tara:strand:- start:50 stop:235 length:186 start_codon:yes stop_codon:yes gene_type:complete
MSDFKEKVWDKVIQARSALESAMIDADRLGYEKLSTNIDTTRHDVLRLLARCADISLDREE